MTVRYVVGDVLDVLAALPAASVDLVFTSAMYDPVMPKNLPVPDRWWEKVDKRGPDECWPWIASRDRDDYGRFQYPRDGGGQVHIRAHRFGYEMLVGPLDEGLCVCHSCDNPPCCNPAHWFLGTNLDNIDDKVAKGRHAKVWGTPLTNLRKTECKRGHALEGNNLRIVNGQRRCRECDALRARIAYRRAHGLSGDGQPRPREVAGGEVKP